MLQIPEAWNLGRWCWNVHWNIRYWHVHVFSTDLESWYHFILSHIPADDCAKDLASICRTSIKVSCPFNFRTSSVSDCVSDKCCYVISKLYNIKTNTNNHCCDVFVYIYLHHFKHLAILPFFTGGWKFHLPSHIGKYILPMGKLNFVNALLTGQE